LQDFEGSDEAGKLTSLSIQTVTCSSMLLSDLEIGSENASLPIQKSAAMVESIYIYIYIYILLGVYTGDSVHAGNSESVPLLGVPTKSGVRTRSQKQRGRTGRVSPSPAIL
jgi:hypothetical protein